MMNVIPKDKADQIKSEFIAMAAHELRTPLTSIQGYSELLVTRSLEPADQKKYLGYINEQAVALAQIVNDLLDISLVETGQHLKLHKTPSNIQETVAHVIGSFAEAPNQIQFEVALASQPAAWLMDQNRIEQVLKNLVSNAVKYSPNGGVIRITGRPDLNQTYYQIVVEDEGIGMTPEQVEQIFDKFYRVDASNTAIGGVGLGMSIAKEIVEAHGGKIVVESYLNRGTKITVLLRG